MQLCRSLEALRERSDYSSIYALNQRNDYVNKSKGDKGIVL